MNFSAIWEILKETFSEWSKDKVSLLAAALAYYTVFSLAPLLIIVIAIASAVFGTEAARNEIVGQIQGLVGETGAQFLQMAIENANKPTTGFMTSIINVIILLFGASGVFAQLQEALNMIWAVPPKPKLNFLRIIQSRFLSFTMVLGIGFLLLVSLVLNAALSAMFNYLGNLIIGIGFFWEMSNFIFSIIITSVLFALIYKILPDVKIAWSNVWVGAIISSVLFNLGKSLLAIYLVKSSFSSTYGAAASPIIVLTWVYYSAQILFFGAELTKVQSIKHVKSQAVDLQEHMVKK